MATTAEVALKGPIQDRAEEVLTPGALEFVARLQREFGARRLELLALRDERQRRLDEGEVPQFVSPSPGRDSEWKVPGAPKDLQVRRAGMPGPPDGKVLIKGLRS